MKKIWNDRESISDITFVALILTFVFVSSYFLYLWSESFTADEQDQRGIIFFISVEGDNYIIEYVDLREDSLDEVSWSILDLNRRVTTWDDPSGESLRMEGLLSDINFLQSEYNASDEVADNKFYSRDPIGTPPLSINHTLCIVLMDVNADGKFCSGDFIWIRSTDNGGPAGEGFRFRLWSGRCLWGEKYLPAV